jgi:hypothetical protein
MKVNSLLLLAGFGTVAFTSCQQSNEDRPNQPHSQTRNRTIAREGERYDNSLGNRTNRAQENGNTQREQELEQRESNAETRQGNREDATGR